MRPRLPLAALPALCLLASQLPAGEAHARKARPSVLSVTRVQTSGGVSMGGAARQLGKWNRSVGARCVHKHLGETRRKGRIELALTLDRKGRIRRTKAQRVGVPPGLLRCVKSGLAGVRFPVARVRGATPVVRARLSLDERPPTREERLRAQERRERRKRRQEARRRSRRQSRQR